MHEKIYATLAYSRIIVDEIQSYDPDMVAVILKGLDVLSGTVSYDADFGVDVETLGGVIL